MNEETAKAKFEDMKTAQKVILIFTYVFHKKNRRLIWLWEMKNQKYFNFYWEDFA